MYLLCLLPLSICFQPILAHPTLSSRPQSSPDALSKNAPRSPFNALSNIYHPQHIFPSPQNQQPILPNHLPSTPHDHHSASPSKSSPKPEQGVTSSQSQGTITMHAPILEQSVKLDFSFMLAPPTPSRPSPDYKSISSRLRGALFHEQRWQEERKSGDQDIPLIEELSIFLLDAHPSGISISPTALRKEEEAAAATVTSTVTISESVRLSREGTTLLGSVEINVIFEFDGENSEQREDEEVNSESEVLAMDRDEWRLLVGLLRSTAVVMKRDVLGVGKGFSELRLAGDIEGIVFDVVWMFWEERLGEC